jgi:hypothetical protein
MGDVICLAAVVMPSKNWLEEAMLSKADEAIGVRDTEGQIVARQYATFCMLEFFARLSPSRRD